MSRKHFSLLLFATFIVASLVLLLPGKTGRESSMEPGEFLPDLEAQVNEIDWLRLTAAGGVTIGTLTRGTDGWELEEASSYPANWTRVKELLSELSSARVIEVKTSNPDYYPRLGVEDVSMEQAGGVMIEFSADSELPALIIGNRAQGRTGQYARMVGSPASVLIDASLDIPATAIEWLDKSIVDISDAEVVEFEVVHPDGASFKAMRISAEDEDFLLQDVPAGQEIKSAWSVNSLANAMAQLELDSVTPDGDFDWGSAVHFRLLTADGLVLDTELQPGPVANGDEAADPEYWIRLRASIYTTAVTVEMDESEGSGDTGERARKINSRVSGWAYRIPGYSFDLMSKRKEDLLQTIKLQE